MVLRNNQSLPEDGWMSLQDISALTDTPKRTLQYRCKAGYYGNYQRLESGCYYIHIYSNKIPDKIRLNTLHDTSKSVNGNSAEIQAELFAELSNFQRDYVLKFQTVYQLTKHLSGNDLKQWLKQYRDMHGKDSAWAYSTFLELRKNYIEHGLTAIIPKWGVHKKGKYKAPDEPYEMVYKPEYMSQRRPSSFECWKQAAGYAKRMDPANFNIKDFPSHSSFRRRLESEVSKSAIYLARYGYAAWNQVYGYSVKRDMSNILAGECWVSDHAQSDIMVTTPDGKVHNLWITVWCDFKSRKWLGWHVHVSAPCTEDIFIAFYKAASKYGLPSHVIVDNGKDYRSTVLTGGRRSWGKIRIEHDERKCVALFGLLDIIVHFAWPYNPQAKIIEMTFHVVNSRFSRHLTGYRGPSILQRPDVLLDEVKKGKLWTDKEFKDAFDSFISDVYNREKFEEGMLKGRRPDELWDKEYPVAVEENRVRHISKAALKKYCAMPSKPNRIRNCKFTCKDLGIEFSAPWMAYENGTKAFYRGDSEDLSEVMFWEWGASQRYLGTAVIDTGAPGLALTEKHKDVLAEKISIKKRTEKQIKKLARVVNTSNDSYLENRKAYIDAVDAQDGYKPSSSKAIEHVIATEMDRVIAEEKKRQKAGLFDYTKIDQVTDNNNEDDLDDLDIWGMQAINF